MARASPVLTFLYSGGAGNANPDLSFGGPASQAAGKYPASQSYTASTIPGIEIIHAARNTAGSGTLEYVFSTNSVKWTDPTSNVSEVILSGDGVVAVGDSVTGYLRLRITAGSLPGSDQSQSITVAQVRDTLFTNPSSNELTSGVTDYRALYLSNEAGNDAISATLTLTDNAPESGITIGSTFIPASRYSTPEADALDFGTMNSLLSVAPYSTSLSAHFPRTTMGAGTQIMTPASGYFPQSYAQNSNGVDEDIEVQLQDGKDSSGKLVNVEWGSSLFWDTIPAGRMVSFWIRRVVPPGPATPTVERALFDLDFTVS